MVTTFPAMARILFVCLASAGFGVVAGQFGWASRELGVCATNEVSCGTRGPGFSACCPSGTFCQGPVSIPGFTDNTGCCPTRDDCSLQIRTYQVCADDNWRLYNASGYPFCCVPGDEGGVGANYDSCRRGGFPSDETPLPIATGGTRPTETSTSSSPASTSPPGATGTLSPGSSNPSPASPSTDSGSSRLSAGAIAGIVVGSILGVALLGFIAAWIGREAGLKKGLAGGRGANLAELGGIDDGEPPTYRESKPTSFYPPAPMPPAPPPPPMELAGDTTQMASELVGDHTPLTSELPA
ncbi:hypothetical protein ABW21_db0203573 [Orbilia brochopaga]|nr:hypothetical protein ABW21_db0203573 [Drechslerella brochopaga]